MAKPSGLELFSKAFGTVGDAKQFADQFGGLYDQVDVTVWGGPISDRRRLFRLAAAIAFGLVKRRGPVSAFIPPPGSIAVEYDAADNYVTFSLKYNSTLFVMGVTSGVLSAPLFYGPDDLPVLGGPAPTVRGGEWNFNGPAIGSTSFVGSTGAGLLIAPTLEEMKDKVLITKESISSPPSLSAPPDSLPAGPTISPRPHADYRSRGCWASLVYTALSTPGTTYDMYYPKPPGGLNDFRGS
jgi:hypothetical protein